MLLVRDTVGLLTTFYVHRMEAASISGFVLCSKCLLPFNVCLPFLRSAWLFTKYASRDDKGKY